MNIESFQFQIREIRARHHCPLEACREVFEFIQLILHQLDGSPIESEFKRALRDELDSAFRGLQNVLRS
jgi:hypothetical protein